MGVGTRVRWRLKSPQYYLEPKAFRDGVRERDRWKGAGYPDEIVNILDKAEEKHVQHEEGEAVNKAAAGGNEPPRRQATSLEGWRAAGIIACTSEREG